MSEQTETQIDSTEVDTTIISETTSTETEGKKQPSRSERRQQRRQEAEQAKASQEPSDGEKAPTGLFSKPATPKATTTENPELVVIIKQQIDEYVAKNGKAAGESAEGRLATLGLQKAIRNLLKLRGESLRDAFKHLYTAIRECDNGAFKLPAPFRWAHDISGETDRIGFTNFMTLSIRYAKLDNPTVIHQTVDVKRTLSFIKDPQGASEILKLFAAK